MTSISASNTPLRLTTAQLESIPCPVLHSLEKNGFLTADENGIVDLADLKVALSRIGLEGIALDGLVGAAGGATKESVAKLLGDSAVGKFNILALRGSNLDHAGDTRILRNGFDQERFNAVAAFATDGRLSLADLARAQKISRTEEPATLRDKVIGVSEITALVRVFGTKDQNGKQSISVQALEEMYKEGSFPAEWLAQLVQDPKLGAVNPNKASSLSLFASMAEMALRQIGMPSGVARLGMDLSTGKDPLVNVTSATGLQKGFCPAGHGATTKQEVKDAHKPN
jgi:hypothetical protein